MRVDRGNSTKDLLSFRGLVYSIFLSKLPRIYGPGMSTDLEGECHAPNRSSRRRCRFPGADSKPNLNNGLHHSVEIVCSQGSMEMIDENNSPRKRLSGGD
jgi:hypothetical protein